MSFDPLSGKRKSKVSEIDVNVGVDLKVSIPCQGKGKVK